ncbi:uncharacterized protein LOC124179658 isoform X2 [Neodiprion fabricii]|uniref:uncharacterized protein LOC124179658 isoform X2 n=1 Tax=Neodiprion fabricii TaxID=2872261 RepID=UPI001ED948B7|nr:uncharacterized protein LOC124179658 isoform X2 [Neodiprion fabricii]
MADGPSGEEAPSEFGTVNRVPKERHKCNNNDVVINIDKEGVRVTESDNITSWASVDEKKKRDVYVGDDDDDDDDDDDYDDDEYDDDDDYDDRDAGDDEEDDDVDDDDEVSRGGSISSGCVHDDVPLRSSATTMVVHKKPLTKETLVVLLHPMSVVGKKTVGSVDDRTALLGEINGDAIRGVIIPEPKRGAAVKSIDKVPTGVGNTTFKGQIRTADDTLVGPCGKKRCVDRYDSSESSDSGVVVSCGECSSSGTSDITEPGSPCSTSSDEGLAGIRSSGPSPLHKLAPPTSTPSRGPQWPWTPPLAATACSTLKKIKGEPEAGTLPKAGAADPTNRGKGQHRHHEGPNGRINCTQGKITEYFKTQIKPQQVKVKKSLEMSTLVAKSSPEFRRPPTVQRNKGGLAKYLGTTPPNGRPNDWEVRTLTMSPPPLKKLPVIAPRAHNKIEKLPNPVPSLPISTNILNSLPTVKLSSMRLPSNISPDPKIMSSPPPTPTLTPTPTPTPTPTLNSNPNPNPTSSPTTEAIDDVGFRDDAFAKPTVNENNNLTSTIIATRSQNEHLSRPPPTGPRTPQDDEVAHVDNKPKEPLSPILSAPTTIRFPAQAPGKNRPQTTDSGICNWDQCDARFESSSGLLEHLQVSHINTQTGGDNFICHWQGCKVQGRTSCSRRWLERHVLSHGGNKPFRCIVDGCGSRFSSQITLERHVNGHFNQPETSSSSSRKSCENGGKLVRRNGKRLRYRRQPWSGSKVVRLHRHWCYGRFASSASGTCTNSHTRPFSRNSRKLDGLNKSGSSSKSRAGWQDQGVIAMVSTRHSSRRVGP